MADRWRILLFASLALNLFVLGAAATMLGGHLMHRWRGPEPMMKGFSAGGLPPPPGLLQALPEETRARLASKFGDERKKGRELFQRVRQARAEAAKSFFADPYSESDMIAALNAAREVDLQAVAAVHEATARILTSLTPEERKALAVKLEPCFHERVQGAPSPPDYCKGTRGARAFKQRWDDRRGVGPPPPPEGGAPMPPPPPPP